jgi:hydrogenase-4 component B
MNTATELFAVFFLLCALGVVAALLMPERASPPVLAAIGTLSALVLLMGSALLLLGDDSFKITLWPVLTLGTMTLTADRLSALFLFVTGLVYLPVSIYSGVYLARHQGHYSLKYFGVLYHTLFAAIAFILIADDAVSFLVAWEFMSIASYLLVTINREQPESAQAGFVMLAMSEAGTIAVIAAFMLLAGAGGTLEFDALRAAAPQVTQGVGWAVFLLSFLGFAVKAGLLPVNSWLPLAHPVAPTNVSALLSAVIVNLGIYGIVRFNLDLHPVVGSGPGLIVLAVGSISALIGILYATVQSEMKRLLAHSTIENMGIVAAGIGAAMIFLATGHAVIAGIALIAALYHLTNHSIYKALLFVGTGAVEAGAGTRDLDRLGGIARRMPWVSAFFLIGVLAISALPPLNGFVSEWLTLQTILRSAVLASAPIKVVFALSGAFLALTAGLAVTCFAKVFAMGFLGMPRSDGAANAAEARAGTRAPLALLALFCILLGFLPTYIIPVIDRTVVPLTHASATAALVPPFFNAETQVREKLPPAFVADFHNLGAQVGAGTLPGRGLVVLHRGGTENPVVFAMSTSYMLCMLAFIIAAVFVAFRLLTLRRTMTRAPVWAGGLRRLTPGITYTATGFSNPVRVIFEAILQPSASEDSIQAVAQHFRTAIQRDRDDVHIVDRWVLDPSVAGLRRLAGIARRMHVGHVNAYAMYILLTMLAVLVAGSVFR